MSQRSRGFVGIPKDTATAPFPAPGVLETHVVIPAKAGIHLLPISFRLSPQSEIDNMGSRVRGNDKSGTPDPP